MRLIQDSFYTQESGVLDSQNKIENPTPDRHTKNIIYAHTHAMRARDVRYSALEVQSQNMLTCAQKSIPRVSFHVTHS